MIACSVIIESWSERIRWLCGHLFAK